MRSFTPSLFTPALSLNPKIETIWSLYFAGPVAANSPTVLTPPIPQWGPSAPRGGVPRSPRHPQDISLCRSKIFSDWG